MAKDYLTAKEAMARLGVKAATLYSYVSRGLVRSVRGDDSRERFYSHDDIESLRAKSRARSGHAPVAAHALRWGEPVLESSITLITEKALYYRGFPVNLLSQRFENVAELLWTGIYPAERGVEWPALKIEKSISSVIDRMARLAVGKAGSPASITSRYSTVIQCAGLLDAERAECRLEESLAKARRIIRLLAAFSGNKKKPEGFGPVAGVFLRGFGIAATPARMDAVDNVWKVSADHELNSSTFAARIAASTGADLYACISAALAALSGPRHGGETAEIEAFLERMQRPDSAKALLRGELSAKRAVHGFGHRLYPEGDPRVGPLMEIADKLSHSGMVRKKIRSLMALMEAEKISPTLDLGLVAVADALGLPEGGAFMLFAVGRTAGWIAHSLEQQQQNTLLRPRARYVGKLK